MTDQNGIYPHKVNMNDQIFKNSYPIDNINYTLPMRTNDHLLSSIEPENQYLNNPKAYRPVLSFVPIYCGLCKTCRCKCINIIQDQNTIKTLLPATNYYVHQSFITQSLPVYMHGFFAPKNLNEPVLFSPTNRDQIMFDKPILVNSAIINNQVSTSPINPITNSQCYVYKNDSVSNNLPHIEFKPSPSIFIQNGNKYMITPEHLNLNLPLGSSSNAKFKLVQQPLLNNSNILVNQRKKYSKYKNFKMNPENKSDEIKNEFPKTDLNIATNISNNVSNDKSQENLNCKKQNENQNNQINFSKYNKFQDYQSILFKRSSSSSFESEESKNADHNKISGKDEPINRLDHSPNNNFQDVSIPVICRFGYNCRFKKQNRCKYYHPSGSRFLKHRLRKKFKSHKIIDISAYSIDSIGSDDIYEKEDEFKLNENAIPIENNKFEQVYDKEEKELDNLEDPNKDSSIITLNEESDYDSDGLELEFETNFNLINLKSSFSDSTSSLNDIESLKLSELSL